MKNLQNNEIENIKIFNKTITIFTKSKRFKLVYKVIRGIKKKLRYTIPYPPVIVEMLKERSRRKKKINFKFYSYRKKQKPYYFKLRLVYYKILKLRKKQSIPTTMKDKIKKHMFKKFARYLVTFFFLLDDGWINIRKAIKSILGFFYKLRAVQNFFVRYYELLSRSVWWNTIYTIKYLLGGVVGLNKINGTFETYLTFSIGRFLRINPSINQNSKIWAGNFKWNEVVKYYVPSNAWKTYIKINSPIYFRLIRRQHIVSSKWSYKASSSRGLYKKLVLTLQNSWGNLGKINYLYCSNTLTKKNYNFIYSLGDVGKKNYLFNSNKTNICNTKKSKRRWVNSIVKNWMFGDVSIEDKNLFLKAKFTSYAFSSFLALPAMRFTSIFGHPYHLVNPSVLPITLSFGFFTVIQNILNSIWSNVWYSNFICTLGHIGMISIFFSIILTWLLEVFSEEQSGAHTIEVQKGFQYAIILFILSELMLFFSFFWAYFHFNLNSNSNIGGSYTPKGIVPFYWYRIPMLNTILLLSSGLSLTISHILVLELDRIKKAFIWINSIFKYRSIIWFNPSTSNLEFDIFYSNRMIKTNINFLTKRLQYLSAFFLFNRKRSWLLKNIGHRSYSHIYRLGRISHDCQMFTSKSFIVSNNKMPKDSTWQFNFWMLSTVVFGFIFLIYQIYEYTSCLFSINDSSYGAVFFSLTGLHGLHVFIGVMSLFLVIVISLKKNFGKSYGSYKTWRRKLHLYLDRSKRAKNSYSFKYWTHRIAFDGSAWYWHFVDVIWFFVFIFVYWWGFVSIV